MSPLLGRPATTGADAALRGLVLAVAILLACTPLSLLFAGPAWWLIPVAGVVVILGMAATIRQLRRLPALVPLVHVAATISLLAFAEATTGVLDPQHGVVTGEEGALHAQVSVLRAGILEIGEGHVPVELGGPGIVLLTLAVSLLIVLLDLLFVDMGWHTPAGFLLIALILAPAVMYPTGAEWWTYAGPLAGGLILFAARTLHSDGAFLVGDERPQTGPLSRRGAMTAGTVAAVAGVLVATPLLARTLPRTARQAVPLDIDVINAWRGVRNEGFGSTMISDSVSVRRGLMRRASTEVLTYTSDAPDPEYLRLYTLFEFDGETFRQRVDAASGAPSAFSDARQAESPPDGEGRYDVSVTELTSVTLPVPPNIGWFETDPEVRVDSVGTQDGTLLLGPRPQDLAGRSYSVVSRIPPFGAQELRDYATPDRDDAVDVTVPERIRGLTRQLLSDAEPENLYDAAQVLVSFFHTEFRYSLTVRSEPGEDPLEAFLTERVGYCEQFAATFALMIRSMGVPSRVGVGFTAGTQDGDQWVVTSHNAHAWPEVWFGEDYGWVRFEPTPPAAGSATRVPQHEVTGDEEEPTPEPTAQEQTTAAPEPSPSIEPSSEEDAPVPAQQEQGQASDGGEGTGTGAGLASGLGILGILVAATAAGAAVVRSRMGTVARDDHWAAASSSRREQGLLAWAEIDRAVRERDAALRRSAAVPWGGARPEARLDRSLPPAEALLALLEQITQDGEDLTPRHREAAASLGAALSDARYAPPIPEDGPTSLREDADMILDLLRRR